MSREVKMQLEHQKIFVQCVWRRCCNWSNVSKVVCEVLMLEISPWMMLHGWVDQLKLIAIKSRPWERSTLYHAADSRHTQNVQINKVIVKNKNWVFYFMEKTERTFWPTLVFPTWFAPPPCLCPPCGFVCLFVFSPSLRGRETLVQVPKLVNRTSPAALVPYLPISSFVVFLALVRAGCGEVPFPSPSTWFRTFRWATKVFP